MKSYPSILRVENAPDSLFEGGHLWLQEKVDGGAFRFQLQESGVIRFGGRNQVYDPGEIPDPYRHAVRHVREHLERDTLEAAVSSVDSVVFFGEAMHKHAIDYDWERTPSFLGFDVWDDSKETFLPPDTVEKIYRGIGLEPVPTVRKEVRAVDFEPDPDRIPSSKYYDGPAEGLIIRNKRGVRAKLLHPQFREVDDTVPVDASAEELAHRYVTEHRLEKLASKLDDRDQPVTAESLYERALEDVVREEHKQLFHGEAPLEMRRFRSTVGEITRRFVSEREE